MSSLKRSWSACEQTRAFNEKWEQEFFVTLNADNSSVSCLICGQSISGLKRSNLQRHFKAKHSLFCNDSPIDSHSRKTKLTELKKNRDAQKICLASGQKASDDLSEASIRISHLICRNKKPFTDGEYLKTAAMSIVETVCHGDPCKDRVLKKIAAIPLSRQTVSRKSEDIASDLQDQLLADLRDCDYISIAFDESTDVCDTAQLCLYVRFVKDLEVREELLAFLHLKDRTSGELVAQAIIKCLQGFDLPLEKIVSCTTDGAKAMTGKHTGCVAIMKKSGLFPNMNITLHCIIHQESLCSKSASIERVMIFVQKTVNFIKKNSALTHRQFRNLLLESETVAKDLLLYTEVRWLSRSAVLDRFCDLLPQIKTFLQSKSKDTSLINDNQFKADLFFLSDISSHLSSLNKCLQGREQLVTDLFSAVSAFRRKLPVFVEDLKEERLFFSQA